MLLNMTLGGFGVQNNDGRLEVHSTVENFASQKHAVRYTPNVKFTGKSGFDHLFEFVIPRSRQQPERILQTINRPSRDTAEAFAFKWIDTKDARSAESRAYAILNDQEHSISAGVLDALHNYDIHPVTWSQRDQLQQELAA